MNTGDILERNVSLDAEKAVLSTILLQHDAIDELSGLLESSDFFSAENQRIYGAAIAIGLRGERIDVLTVKEELKRTDSAVSSVFLAELCDATPAVAHVLDHARIVRDKSRVRSMIDAANKIRLSSSSVGHDVQEWLDRCEQDVFAVSHEQSQDGPEHIKPILRSVFREIDDRTTGRIPDGFATGLIELDGLLGTLQRGEVYIIAGRPGMGKSALATTICHNVIRNESQPAGALIFSLEMPRSQVALRMACAEAKIDVAAVRRNQLPDGAWPKITAAVVELSSLPLWIDDKAGIKPSEIRAHVRRKQAECRRMGKELGVVAVDYLQLCNGRDGVPRNASREQEIAYISRSMKEIAKECGIAMIAMAQLSRSCEARNDKRPMLSDLRESGSLEQDADAVLFVYRHEYYNEGLKGAEGVAEIDCAKHRSLPIGTARVSFNGKLTRFEDLSAERTDNYLALFAQQEDTKGK